MICLIAPIPHTRYPTRYHTPTPDTRYPTPIPQNILLAKHRPLRIPYLALMTANNLNESFGTLSETVNGLIRAGYNLDFNIQHDCLICNQTDTVLSPDEFQIDKVYRFEGATNPDDESIVYAISSEKFKVKGLLVNGYGIYAEEASSKLVEKLQTHINPANFDRKANEATTLRPEGNRILNAPFVEMNLNKFMDQIKGEKTWSESDRNSITIFKSETMRIVLMALHAKGELKPHKANGIISVQVLEGKMNFITEEQTAVLEKGQMIALQENITHSVLALTDTYFLLTLVMNK